MTFFDVFWYLVGAIFSTAFGISFTSAFFTYTISSSSKRNEIKTFDFGNVGVKSSRNERRTGHGILDTKWNNVTLKNNLLEKVISYVLSFAISRYFLNFILSSVSIVASPMILSNK